MEARAELVNPALEWLAGWTRRSSSGVSMARRCVGRGSRGLRRNVAIAMGNSGLKRFAPWLEKWAEAADETPDQTGDQGLRAAARWALNKLGGALCGCIEK